MALIAMAVYDTEENQRTEYTKETLENLFETVDFEKHRLVVIDNNSCHETLEYLLSLRDRSNFYRIDMVQNIGTAKAINKAWALRSLKEHLIKMDNDVVINSYGWIDEMEEAIERDSSIGILGLKRKDLLENPFRNDQFKSTLRMLPHQNGQPWIIVEDVGHVMGTCQMYNHRLIDKIGGLMQPGVYGFDDTLSSIRCKLAGFKNSFLPHIDIEHIDHRETPYWQEKREIAKNAMPEFNQMKADLISGKLSKFVKL